MTELVIYRGLPASGKTTLAEAFVAADPASRARVNRDDLRRMLHGGVYLGHETEGRVVAAEDAAIRALLEAGSSVACDDTNLSQKRARGLAAIARAAGVGVHVCDLTDVPLELCLERDRERIREGRPGVGDDVILWMHSRYLAGRGAPLPDPRSETIERTIEPYVAKPGTPRAIMVDLDGTLAIHDGRSPFDETLIHTDVPNPAVVETIRQFYVGRHNVVYCSGRTQGCYDETAAWIVVHVGIDDFDLYMRQVGDTRKDSIVKREIFDAHIRDEYDVRLVLDDRQQVVDMWRELGLTVFQVAPGDF